MADETPQLTFFWSLKVFAEIMVERAELHSQLQILDGYIASQKQALIIAGAASMPKLL